MAGARESSSAKPFRLVSHHLTACSSSYTSDDYTRPARTVPTSHPEWPSEGAGESSRNTGHALEAAARLEYPHDGSGSSFVILVRAIENAETLELSMIPLDAPTHDASSELSLGSVSPKSATPPPQLFLLPAPVMSGLSIFLDEYSGDLHVVAVTITGWLFRLRFLMPSVFYSDTLPYDWAQEHKIASLSHLTEDAAAVARRSSAEGPASSSPATATLVKLPTLVHVVESGLVLVACNDGSLIKLEQSRSDDGDGKFVGAWRESSLKSTSFLSSFSRFFNRSSNSQSAASTTVIDGLPSHTNSVQTHIVALDTLLRDDASALAFTITRDRRIRIWDLVTDTCLMTAELPTELLRPASRSDDEPTSQGLATPTSLPPFGIRGSLRPLCHVFALSGGEDFAEYPAYMLVFVPAPLPIGSFFALYGIEFAERASRSRTPSIHLRRQGSSVATSGGVAELALLWQRPCDDTVRNLRAELRDVTVLQASSSEQAPWQLWCLWDCRGSLTVQRTLLGRDGDDSSPWLSTQDSDATTAYSPLRGAEVDAFLASLLQNGESNSMESISQFYIGRIMEAGRFDIASLRWSLRVYASSLEASLNTARRQLPPTLQPGAIFANTTEQLAGTVAAGVQLEVDPDSGAVRMDQFHTQVRREWQKFVGLLMEADTHGRWPIAFIRRSSSKDDDEVNLTSLTPLILSRNRITAFTLEGHADSLYRAFQAFASGERSFRAQTGSVDLNPHRNFLVGLVMQLRTKDEEGPLEYCNLSEQDLANSCISIAEAASLLHEKLPPLISDRIYQDVFRSASTPLDADVSDVALEWWNSATTIDAVGSELQARLSCLLTGTADGSSEATRPAGTYTSRGSMWGQSALEPAFWKLSDLLVESYPSFSKATPSINLAGTVASEAATSFVADEVNQSLRNRLFLSRALLLLALFVHWVRSEQSSLGVQEGSSTDGADSFSRHFEFLPYLIARLVSITHQVNVFTNLFDHSSSPELSLDSAVVVGGSNEHEEAEVTTEISKLVVSGNSRPSGAIVLGLANTLAQYCLMRRIPPFDAGTNSREMIAAGLLLREDCIAGNARYFLASLGLPSRLGSRWRTLGDNAGQFPLLQHSQVVLGRNLLLHAHPTAVQQMVRSLPSSPCSQYLLARACLQHQLFAPAAQAFHEAARGALSLGHESATNENREAVDFAFLVPQSVASLSSFSRARLQGEVRPDWGAVAASTYYRHVADLFEAAGADVQTAEFAQLAVQSAKGSNGTLTADLDSQALRSLYFRLFRAQLSLGHFAQCYQTVMDIPFGSLRCDCLRTLISATCESGAYSELLGFNFAGLQPEVERNLSFKARNSDPRTNPPYFQILYSYHMRRVDYKSAGAVMYQQAHKLADLYRHGRDGFVYSSQRQPRPPQSAADAFIEVSILQARSYLAAINALSLLDGDNAWFADAVTQSTAPESAGEDAYAARPMANRPTVSRKVSSYIPSQHWQSGSREIRIVQIVDVCLEYRLVLARLEVVQLYPELAKATMTLNPSDVVALLIRNNQYDKAFASARGLKVDQSGIFASLAVKCAAADCMQNYRRRLDREWLQRQDPDGTNAEANALLESMAIDADEAGSWGFEPQTALLDDEDDLGEAIGDVTSAWAFLRTSERTAGWSGSLAERAWRYLRLNLEIEDARGFETGWRYRTVVLERLLNLSANGTYQERVQVPAWLLEWFENYQPHLLVTAYMKANLVDAALTAAISWIKRSTLQISKMSVLGGRERASGLRRSAFIPYMTLDALIQRALDSDARPSGATKSAAATRELADTLKNEVVNGRFRLLEKMWREEKGWAEDKERREIQSPEMTLD